MGVEDINRSADRRRHDRFRAHLALAIDAGERTSRVGITQDASVEGVLFNSRSSFAPGEELMLTLHAPELPFEGTRVRARVIRVREVDARSDLPWRWLTAVQFEHPLPEIEPCLRASEEQHRPS